MCSTGSRTGVSGAAVGGGEGIFFFERFAADSPEQKLTLCDDVAGCHRRGASV